MIVSGCGANLIEIQPLLTIVMPLHALSFAFYKKTLNKA
jgi:hypothetical protein